MGKNSNTWKRFETFVAKCFGGSRHGPHTSQEDAMDVDHQKFAIECKLHGQVGYALIQADIERATAKGGDKYPVSVVRKKGDVKTNTLVCMRIDDFCRLTGLPGVRYDDEDGETTCFEDRR